MNTPINFVAAGDNVVIPAKSGYRFLIRKMYIVASGAVQLTIKSGTTVIGGPMSFAGDIERVFNQNFENDPPWFTTASGEDFVIHATGGGTTVGGCIVYDQVEG